MNLYISVGLTLLLSTLLNGCAIGYNSAVGGISYKEISKDTYDVSFSGNSHNSDEDVKLYLMTKASELAIQNNYKYFYLIDDPIKTIRASSFLSYYNGGNYRRSQYAPHGRVRAYFTNEFLESKKYIYDPREILKEAMKMGLSLDKKTLEKI